jgi:fibronectin-binding autotransporter adhesin
MNIDYKQAGITRASRVRLQSRAERERAKRRARVSASVAGFFCSTALAVVLALSISAPAAAQTWTGATSSDWTNGSNWNTGVVPSGTNVTISTNSPNPTVLGVGGAAAGTTGDIAVGNGAGTTGNLTIQNGSTLTTTGFNKRIGSAAGSTGTVTVTGAGSQWTLSGRALSVGSLGNGTLNIEDGGKVIRASFSAPGAT